MTGAINASDDSSLDAESKYSESVVPVAVVPTEVPQRRLRVGVLGFVVLSVLAIASVLMVLYGVPMNANYWGIFHKLPRSRRLPPRWEFRRAETSAVRRSGPAGNDVHVHTVCRNPVHGVGRAYVSTGDCRVVGSQCCKRFSRWSCCAGSISAIGST